MTDKAKEYIKELLNVEPGMELREDLLSYHACNPFVPTTSASRSYMMSSHHSQRLTLDGGDEKIIQSGLEKQLGENTHSKKCEHDCEVIAIINRYNGISAGYANALTEKLIIVEDLVTGEIDYIDVPYKHVLQGHFGFKYKWNEDILSAIGPGTVLKEGTILADSPAVTTNSGYKYGLNANIALITLPETDKDGIIISESMSKRLAFKIFETRVVEFGANSFALNLYGDEYNYKPFPDIGEKIKPHSVLMALREYDDKLAPALVSKNDVRDFDPLFDKCVYVRGPGKDIELLDGSIVESGIVRDIKAYYNPKSKKEVYTNTTGCVDKYINGIKRYYKEIIDCYELLKKNHYAKYKNYELPLSNKFHKLLIDAFAIANPNNDKLTYTSRNEPTDIYRIEFTIEYTILPGVGYKLSDSFGAKGVIVEVRPDHLMPLSKDGTIRADCIMDPISVISRMNIGRFYDIYLAGCSRRAKSIITNILANEPDVLTAPSNLIEEAWNHVLAFTKIFETEQYDYYSKVGNEEEKRLIIKEIIDNEFFIYYKVTSKKKPIELVDELVYSPYAAVKDQVWLDKDGTPVLSKRPALIAPNYMILLCKTADSYLSVASAKLNHYGLPINIGSSERNRSPYRGSPTKNMSETDTRIYIGYPGRLAAAEMKDRANSITTHEEIYKNILLADKPTNIDEVIDRDRFPFGTDESLTLVDRIMNAAGIEVVYEHSEK